MKSLRKWFKFYLSFKGRINRKTYILIALKQIPFVILYTYVFAFSVIALTEGTIRGPDRPGGIELLSLGIIMGSIVFPFILFTIVSQITLIVRRLHDLNLSGYWLLFLSLLCGFSMIFAPVELSHFQIISFLWDIIILFVFLLCFFMLFVAIFFLGGNKKDNKYGSDPSLQAGNLCIPRLPRSVFLLFILITVLTIIVFVPISFFTLYVFSARGIL